MECAQPYEDPQEFNYIFLKLYKLACYKMLNIKKTIFENEQYNRLEKLFCLKFLKRDYKA